MRGIKFIFAFLTLFCTLTFAQTNAPVNYAVNPNLSKLFVVQKSGNEAKFSGDIYEMINNFFSKNINIEIKKPTYSDILEAGLDGEYDKKYVDLIAGIYYDEKNLKYLRYVPVPFANDNIIIAYSREMRTEFIDLYNVDFLQETDVKITGITGVNLDQIITNKYITYKTFEEVFHKVLNEGEVFIGSERMLRDYILKNPDVKSLITAKHLKKENKLIQKRLFFAFNRDFLELQENKYIIKDFSAFIRQYKKR